MTAPELYNNGCRNRRGAPDHGDLNLWTLILFYLKHLLLNPKASRR